MGVRGWEQVCGEAEYVSTVGTYTSDVACTACAGRAETNQLEATACAAGTWEELGAQTVCGAACTAGTQYVVDNACKAYTVRACARTAADAPAMAACRGCDRRNKRASSWHSEQSVRL